MLCACGCGRTTEISKSSSLLFKGKANRFIHGHSHQYKKTHGMTHTGAFNSYNRAKTRCTNSNRKDWKDYGGRGIKFLFTSFEQFLSELGPRPDGKTLDRFPNNDGNYEPGNVRWATMSQQGRNRRRYAAIQNFSNEELLSEVKRRGLA